MIALRTVFVVVSYANRTMASDSASSFRVRLERPLERVVSLDWVRAVFNRGSGNSGFPLEIAVSSQALGTRTYFANSASPDVKPIKECWRIFTTNDSTTGTIALDNPRVMSDVPVDGPKDFILNDIDISVIEPTNGTLLSSFTDVKIILEVKVLDK
jgi:hypothetical protein